VHDTSQRGGNDVVLRYFRQRQACVARPLPQLRATLAPGERNAVKLTLDSCAFSLWNAQMKEMVEPGVYELMTGNSSLNLQTVLLEIQA